MIITKNARQTKVINEETYDIKGMSYGVALWLSHLIGKTCVRNLIEFGLTEEESMELRRVHEGVLGERLLSDVLRERKRFNCKLTKER